MKHLRLQERFDVIRSVVQSKLHPLDPQQTMLHVRTLGPSPGMVAWIQKPGLGVEHREHIPLKYKDIVVRIGIPVADRSLRHAKADRHAVTFPQRAPHVQRVPAILIFPKDAGLDDRAVRRIAANLIDDAMHRIESGHIQCGVEEDPAILAQLDDGTAVSRNDAVGLTLAGDTAVGDIRPSVCDVGDHLSEFLVGFT